MTQALKILHVISGDLWAGAEVQAFTLLSRLARMPDTEVAAAVMNEGRLANQLRAVGIRVYVLDERRLRPFRIIVGLRRILREWRPDVIHTHRQKENILGTLANRVCRNVPSVRTVHGADEHSGATKGRRIRRRVVTEIDRWCARASRQTVVAVSSGLGVKVAQDFPAANVVVIENGVDAEGLRAERGVADFRTAGANSTHVGIVGRLVPVKRVDLFLETADFLRRRCPERRWSFHVFGDGPARSDLEAFADRMRVSDAVTFHGHRTDIATCIGGLDALVICSDHEGMPMTALEAAALEVPTVAHAVGGLVDIVPKEFLVARHEADAYGEAILRAMREESRGTVSKHAGETSIRFSAQGNAERVRALYKQVVAQRGAR